MKKRLIFFILILFFVKGIFSQEYFEQFMSCEEFFYKNEKIDLTELYFFCDKEGLIKEYIFFYHDSNNNKYYLRVNDEAYKLFYLFELEKDKILIDKKIKIETSYKSILKQIDNNKILFIDLNKDNENDFFILDLKTLERIDEISISNKQISDSDKVTIAYKNDKIFFEKKGYYDIKKGKVFYYPVRLSRIVVDEKGERIVGIDKDYYITIVNLKTNEIKRLKQKRKFKYEGETTNTGTFCFKGDELYFSIKQYSIGYLIASLLPFSQREERQWYKIDLKTGKRKRVKQPTRLVDMY